MRCLSHILGFFNIELYLAPCSHLSQGCRWKAAAAGLAEGQETQLPSQPAGGLGGIFLVRVLVWFFLI